MNIRDKILEVLEKTHLMSLATSDSVGLWVADVMFVFDDQLNIYWKSSPDCRHSKAILENNQVAGTITFSTKSKEPNLGIQFSGIASKIEGARYDLAVKHLKKRDRPEPKEEDDILQGNSWYMIKPTKIDLIDELESGFVKTSLDL